MNSNERTTNITNPDVREFGTSSGERYTLQGSGVVEICFAGSQRAFVVTGAAHNPGGPNLLPTKFLAQSQCWPGY